MCHKLEPLKQAPPVSEYERVDHDAKQINQMLAKQDPVKGSCSVLHDVFAWLLLDPSNFFPDVSLDDGGVPGRFLEGRGRHVLRNTVHAVHEVHRASSARALGDGTDSASESDPGLADGVVIAQGIQRLRRTLPEVLAAETLPALVREVVGELRERLLELDRRITEYDHRIDQLATQNEAARRLMKVEGVGPMTATAIVARIGEGTAFQHGRQFAAWLGLVPKQHSTGGKTMLGGLTKHGNVYLRTLLIHGARAVLQFSMKRTDRKSRWVEAVRQ